jgi:hypothetical protein
VAPGHHQHDRQQAGDRQRIVSDAGLAEPSGPRRRLRVHVLGDAICVDDGHEPVAEDDEVEHEDRAQHERVEDQPEEFDAIQPQRHAGDERDEQDRHGGEREGARRRAGIQLTESGEDQGEEGRREWRPSARWRARRFVHRG